MFRIRTISIPFLFAVLLLVGLSSCRKNLPPDVPTVPAGPAFCFKDTTCTFTTIATDPDGDSVAVRFDWGDSTYSIWAGWHASGDTIAVTHAWPTTGTFEVRAWAMDQKQLTSVLSGACTLQVAVRLPPYTPAAPTGADIGGKDSSYTFAAVARHPDSISVAIRFQWGDGDTSDWSPFVASGESAKMSHAWSVPGTYVMNAQARDTGNALSAWSANHTIIIRPPDTVSLWRFQLAAGPNNNMRSSPAIGADGTIYVGSPDSSLYAVNPDGTLRWRFGTGGKVTSTPALAADGTIYFSSYDDSLYAVKPDGTLRWSLPAIGHATSCPAIAADGTIYHASSNDRLNAVGPDGTLKWSYYTGDNNYSSPAVAADGTIYVGSQRDYFYALNPDSSLRWRADILHGGTRSSPAIGPDGAVYFGTDDLAACCLNPDGTFRWQGQAGPRVRSSPPIAADGTVFFGSMDNNLYALNPDGTVRWTYLSGGNVDVSPAIASDGTIYLASDSTCFALYPDGTLKWRYATGGSVESSPAIGPDGTVYFTSFDGYLYALKGSSPLADSPWPKFHHDLSNTGRVGGGR